MVLNVGTSIAGIMVEFFSEIMFRKYYDEIITEVQIENGKHLYRKYKKLRRVMQEEGVIISPNLLIYPMLA